MSAEIWLQRIDSHRLYDRIRIIRQFLISNEKMMAGVLFQFTSAGIRCSPRSSDFFFGHLKISLWQQLAEYAIAFHFC